MIRVPPDPACPHCHGRGGYSFEKDYGFDRVSEHWRQCSCTNPIVREIIKQRKQQ